MIVILMKNEKVIDVFGKSEKIDIEKLKNSEIKIGSIRNELNLSEKAHVEVLNPENDIFFVILRDENEYDILKKSDALLSAIIDSTNDAISVADTKGRIVLVNKAYTRLTGFSPSEVIGQYATVDIAEGESVHMKVAKEKKPIYGVKMKVGPMKKEVLVNCTPLFVGGSFRGSVAVIHDISEMIRLANELEETRRLVRRLQAKYTFDDVVAKSRKMRIALEQAKRVSKTPATVLLRGESGTGKELFAHAIHNLSDRANGPFVSVNCAALPESILESELFGYEEGAFTGARKGGKKGLIEEADGGTLFLDEIGKMGLGTQSKFLRFIQDKEIYQIGGTKPIRIDVRIIAATNMDLESMMEEGKFLPDLYYRLNVVPIFLPPLRERMEDFDDLVRLIIKKLNQEFGRIVEGIEKKAMEILRSYEWPGNVRELENTLGRAMINMDYDERVMKEHHLPPLNVSEKYVFTENLLKESKLKDIVAEVERRMIEKVLKDVGGHRERAARKLGISLRNLYYKMKKYGIKI